MNFRTENIADLSDFQRRQRRGKRREGVRIEHRLIRHRIVRHRRQRVQWRNAPNHGLHWIRHRRFFFFF